MGDPLHAVLSALDLLALALAPMQLGWEGLVPFLGVNIVGFLAWGAAEAIYVDAELASAAALGGGEKSGMRALSEALEKDQALKVLGPQRRANLIRMLSERARTSSEIRHMAAPIGLLWIVGDNSLGVPGPGALQRRRATSSMTRQNATRTVRPSGNGRASTKTSRPRQHAGTCRKWNHSGTTGPLQNAESPATAGLSCNRGAEI